MQTTEYDAFTLNIEMGNDAMSTPEDVATQLREIADKLEAGSTEGTSRDVNGNTVGRYELS